MCRSDAISPQRGKTTQLSQEQAQKSESVLNDALTGLDNKALLQVAKSRGIDVTREAQLKPGVSDTRIIRKIIDDFSQDELDNARSTGLEISRQGPAPNNFATPKLAADAWHLKVLQTYFPDVKLNAAALKRVQAAQSQAPPLQRPTVPMEGMSLADLLRQSVAK